MKRFIGSCLLLLALVAVTATGAENRKPAMTQQEKDDARYLFENMKPGVPYRLTLANPIHYRYVLSALKRAGESAELSPRFYQAMREASRRGDPNAKPVMAVARGPDGEPQAQDLNFINILTLTKAPDQFHANGISSVIGGTSRTLALMELFTDDDNFVYASASGSTSVDGAFFQQTVDGTVPKDNPDKTTKALGLFQYVLKGGTYVGPITYYTDATVNPVSACMTAPNYCVRDPTGNCTGAYQTTCTNNVPNTTPIQVCYWRGSQGECDYYNQAPQHPTDFVFPTQGSAQFGNEPVQPIRGTMIYTLLNKNNGGGCYLDFSGETPPIFIGTDWTVSGNSAAWNYPASAFPDPNACLAYTGGTNTLVNFQVSISLQGSKDPSVKPAIASFTFTSDRTQAGGPGVYIVPSINIQQGCFSSGTRVRMADGGERLVDSFMAGSDEVVKTKAGSAKVTSTTSGLEPEPMIRIRTDHGHDLLVTRTHPIVTTGGALMAWQIKAGMRVLTEDGEATVASAATERFTGKVFNLRVAVKEGAPLEDSAVYANGILAGDIRGQHLLEEADAEKLKKPVEARKRVPREWLEDYDRHVKAGRE